MDELLCGVDTVLDYFRTFSTDDPVAMVVVRRVREFFGGGGGDLTNKSHFAEAQALSDFIWEKLNTGHWSGVDPAWRKLYAAVAALRVAVVAKIIYGSKNNGADILDDDDDAILEDLVRMCDAGLLLGQPVLDNVCARWAAALAGNIRTTSKSSDKRKNPDDDDVRRMISGGAAKRPRSDGCRAVGVETADLGLGDFLVEYKRTAKPVFIRNGAGDWPAISSGDNDNDNRWSVGYFRRVMGFRTVPVEVGKRYTDESWTQTLMTVNEFIDRYMSHDGSGRSTTTTTGYLAQHELFRQVPELSDDFYVPIYCYASEEKGVDDEDDDVAINIWLGPEGTVSPLHTDPRHNFLVQVFGRKYVRLYGAEQTAYLYPHDDGDMLSNTSRVDVEEERGEIAQKFPEFSKARGYDCVLEPGDMLYIPPKCWHFVKSLSPSCSISFWFD